MKHAVIFLAVYLQQHDPQFTSEAAKVASANYQAALAKVQERQAKAWSKLDEEFVDDLHQVRKKMLESEELEDSQRIAAIQLRVKKGLVKWDAHGDLAGVECKAGSTNKEIPQQTLLSFRNNRKVDSDVLKLGNDDDDAKAELIVRFRQGGSPVPEGWSEVTSKLGKDVLAKHLRTVEKKRKDNTEELMKLRSDYEIDLKAAREKALAADDLEEAERILVEVKRWKDQAKKVEIKVNEASYGLGKKSADTTNVVAGLIKEGKAIHVDGAPLKAGDPAPDAFKYLTVKLTVGDAEWTIRVRQYMTVRVECAN